LTAPELRGKTELTGVPPLRLEHELATFARHAGARHFGAARGEPIDQYAFVVRPDGDSRSRIDLLLMALTHGNEFGGLLVLNALCALLESGQVTPSISVGLVLCNVAAARRQMRQVDRDLNRTFGRVEGETLEDRRAREVEPMMRRARFSVDFHQTIEPSHTPFLVFAYEPLSLRFARGILPRAPVVTHWGRPFSGGSNGGCTSDEFIHRQGGVAVSVELGQKGDDVYQVAVGLSVCLHAMTVISVVDGGGELPPLSDELNPIYTWGDIVPYPDGHVLLEPGLTNFQPIQAGQRLGALAGDAVLAPSSGYLLFPKYVGSSTEPRPAELYRLLRRASLSELGRGDCLTSHLQLST
jgi:succinylglutamate desuccinylase